MFKLYGRVNFITIFASYERKKQNWFFITSFAPQRYSHLDKGNISYENFHFRKWYLNESSNFPIQSTGVDILSMA